jgi:hypothetical protein
MHSATFRLMFLYWIGIKGGAGTGLVRKLDGESDREYCKADINIGNVTAL